MMAQHTCDAFCGPSCELLKLQDAERETLRIAHDEMKNFHGQF